MKITKKQLKRMDEIQDNAITYYLEKMDFNMFDAMPEKEMREYQKLHFLTDSACVICGNLEIMYWCEDCSIKEGDTDVSEKPDKCQTCGNIMVVDKDYHNNCN